MNGRHAGTALRSILAIALATTAFACSSANRSAAPLTDRPELDAFADEMAANHGFDRDEVMSLFEGFTIRDDIIEAVRRPAEALPWHRYRPIFVTADRTDEGVVFWQQHRGVLERAEDEYGVPPEVMVAIIGVETRYGSSTGRYPVLESLATLAFDYPPRSAFFRSELEHFLLLAREENLEPTSIHGSYAGAMGKPQFISSSYRHYAVDFDGSGRRDLFNSTADSVGSVANYLREHGWRSGEPVAVRADAAGDLPEHLRDNRLEPHTTVGELRQAGIEPRRELDDEYEATLITLDGADGEEHWIGLRNFYVISRYNHSALYTMAVHQLSKRIRAGMADGGRPS